MVSARENWIDLECTSCAGTQFIQPFTFIKHDTQGTTKRPGRIVCLTCGKDSDPALMAKKMEMAHRVEELKQLQEQASALEDAQKALDDQLFQEDPVEVRDLIVKRAKATRSRKSSKD